MILLLDTPVYKLQAEVDGSTYYIHMDYKLETFSKSIYLNLFEQWSLILKELKAKGVKKVASAIPHGWDKVMKWQTMFGLSPVKENDKFVIFEMEIQ